MIVFNAQKIGLCLRGQLLQRIMVVPGEAKRMPPAIMSQGGGYTGNNAFVPYKASPAAAADAKHRAARKGTTSLRVLVNTNNARPFKHCRVGGHAHAAHRVAPGRLIKIVDLSLIGRVGR